MLKMTVAMIQHTYLIKRLSQYVSTQKAGLFLAADEESTAAM